MATKNDYPQYELVNPPRPKTNQATLVYDDDRMWVIAPYNIDLTADFKAKCGESYVFPPSARGIWSGRGVFAWWFAPLYESGARQFVEIYYPQPETIIRTARELNMPPDVPTVKLGLSLAKAREGATQLQEFLRPYCQRVEIGGSIRREKAEGIKDIELVAIPDGNRLDAALEALVNQGYLQRGDKNGAKFKNFVSLNPEHPCGVDLYITTPEMWAVIFAIRTGASEFAHQFVTRQGVKTHTGRMGLLKSEFAFVKDGRVWRHSQEAVKLESEREFFEQCVIGGWREPKDRK